MHERASLFGKPRYIFLCTTAHNNQAAQGLPYDISPKVNPVAKDLPGPEEVCIALVSPWICGLQAPDDHCKKIIGSTVRCIHIWFSVLLRLSKQTSPDNSLLLMRKQVSYMYRCTFTHQQILTHSTLHTPEMMMRVQSKSKFFDATFRASHCYFMRVYETRAKCWVMLWQSMPLFVLII